MMSPLYPSGKPCAIGTHNEEGKMMILFSAINDVIMIETGCEISNPVGMLSVLQSNRKFYHIYTITIVIHKSHNLIGTAGTAEFRTE